MKKKPFLSTDESTLFFFKNAFGKCLQFVVQFITDPFNCGVSNKFIAAHDSADTVYGRRYAHANTGLNFEPTILRDHREYMIPNTEEMKKLTKIINLAFDNINLKNKIVLNEKELLQKRFYYLRGFYSLSFLTTAENHQFMQSIEPAYISIVFSYLFEGLESEVMPMHSAMLVHLLKFYRTIDPNTFFKEMIQYNLVYSLLINCDNSLCVDFLIELISFCDR